MAKLDSLVVDLQLNSAALRSGLDAAKSSLDTFGSAVKGIGDKLSALTSMQGFELGKDLVKGLGEFVLKGSEAVDKMGKLAQAAGEPVEVFSRLAYGANLSGVSAEDLGQAFNHLNKNLAAAGAGGRDQVALFSALGVKVTDTSGKVRDSAAVMSDLATRFAGMKDGASKGALAMEVFGKAGASLLPFLNEGGAGLAKLSAEADRFGITVSAGAAAAAQEFNDNLERLKLATSAVGARVAAELAPALTALTSQLLNSKEGADALKGAAEVLATTLRILVSAGIIVGAVFDAVGTSIGRAGSAIVDAAHGDFSAVLDLQNGFQVDMLAAASTGLDRIKAVWATGTGAEEALKKQDEAGKKSADAAMANLAAQKKAAAEAEAAMKSLTATLNDYLTKLAEAGDGAGEDGFNWVDQLNAKLDNGKIADELKKIGSAADEMRQKLFDAALALHSIEMAKLNARIDFDVGRSTASTGADIAKRTKDFGNVGKSSNDIRLQDQAGFASFDAAMAEFAKQQKIHAELIGAAEISRADGETKAAEMALVAADSAQRAGEQASRAAEAFRAGKEALYSALQGMAAHLTSKMGDVGDVLNAAVQGFASGGIWGAIIGIIGEVVTKLSGFMRIVDSMNAFFSTALKNIDNALGPLFDALINLGETFGSLIEMVTSMLGAFEILKGVMWVISKVIDFVVLSIVGAVQLLLAAVGIHDKKIDDMVKKTSKDMEKGLDLSGFEQTDTSVKKLGDTAAVAAGAVGKVADKFGEMLTNIPNGFKVGAARFGADKGISGGGSGAGGSSSGAAGGWDQSDERHSNTQGTGTGGDTPPPGISGATLARWWADHDAAKVNSVGQSQYEESTRPTDYSKSDEDTYNDATHQDEYNAAHPNADPVTVVNIENLTLGAKNFADFVKQITDLQGRKTAVRSRNPFPHK